MNKNKKIAHVTSVHRLNDARIFHKECKSLAENGYKVTLVGFGEPPEFKDIPKLNAISLGPSFKSRKKRLFEGSKKLKQYVIENEFDLVHFHDPELLPFLTSLKKYNIKTVFDIHEDLPGQIEDKAYIPTAIRKPLATFVKLAENRYVKKCSGIIAATPYIQSLFSRLNSNIETARNFPLISEFEKFESTSLPKNRICYIGGITAVRGVIELLDALVLLNGKIVLDLAGPIDSIDLQNRMEAHQGWKHVKYHGMLERNKVSELLAHSSLGMVTLHPNGNYVNSIPVKMFEYLISGMYVIASNFNYWKTLTKEVEGVSFVDPLDAKAIAESIEKNLKEINFKNNKGREFVLENLTWQNEEKALFKLYDKIFAS